MVMELLVGDQPPRITAHDSNSKFWAWADTLQVEESRYPSRPAPAADTSHTAIAVNMDACIACQLCVQACRVVQVNDVIGLSRRGSNTEVVFDFGDPMGESTCVSCGECVQACPTGALLPNTTVNNLGVGVFAPGIKPDRQVDSVCPVLWCGLSADLQYPGR